LLFGRLAAARQTGWSIPLGYTRDYRYHQSRTRRSMERETAEGFVCRNCNTYVPCEPALAGVQNRNHCPYCLWSRHMDGRVAGDRRSGCRGAMRPLGLTTKRSANKYAAERDGELMIVHRCTVCAKLVLNRIAADDSDPGLMALVERPCNGDAELLAALEGEGVSVLTTRDRALVRRRLYGKDR
jgi:hypothetical protein